MDISVIIPYYNQGVYLKDALKSLGTFKAHPNYKCEVIIINDGCTDAASITVLDEIRDDGYIIIHQANKGAAAARNAGLAIARGEYILFLDSDNKLRDVFIYKALPVLQNADVDIVYGKPKFFGDASKPLFTTGKFHLPTLLARNYIDICCLFKRRVYETIGGLDEAEVLNQEDWEYWIRAAVAGFKFYFVNDIFYDYRIHSRSATSAVNAESYYQARKYVYDKHPKLVIDSFLYLTRQFHRYERDKERPLRSLVKFLYRKYINKEEEILP